MVFMLNKIIAFSFMAFFALSYALNQNEKIEYEKAFNLIQEEKYDQYYKIKKNLINTSLYPYLQYLEISTDPDHFTQKTIKTYLDSQKTTVFYDLLKADLATYYAEQKKWTLFKEYDPKTSNSSKWQCWRMNQFYNLGEQDKALTLFTRYWQKKVNISNYCKSIYTVWENQYDLSIDEVYNKVITLLNYQRLNSALNLLKKYKIDDNHLIQFINDWSDIDSPELLYAFYQNHKSDKYFDLAFSSSFNTLESQQISTLKEWINNSKNFTAYPDRIRKMMVTDIAITLGQKHENDAIKWLFHPDIDQSDYVAMDWRLRMALWNNNFNQYYQWYQTIPDRVKDETKWKYWYAIALMHKK